MLRKIMGYTVNGDHDLSETKAARRIFAEVRALVGGAARCRASAGFAAPQRPHVPAQSQRGNFMGDRSVPFPITFRNSDLKCEVAEGMGLTSNLLHLKGLISLYKIPTALASDHEHRREPTP